MERRRKEWQERKGRKMGRKCIPEWKFVIESHLTRGNGFK